MGRLTEAEVHNLRKLCDFIAGHCRQQTDRWMTSQFKKYGFAVQLETSDVPVFLVATYAGNWQQRFAWINEQLVEYNVTLLELEFSDAVDREVNGWPG